MAEDYYAVLEVPRSATQDEIQKSYRRLARKYHPDLHGNSDESKKKFQRLQQAYDVLGDEEKRKQYDRFGPGFEQMRGAPGGGGPFGGMDIDFSQMFGQGGQGGPMPGGPMPGGGGLEDILRTFGMGGGRAGRRGAGRGAPEAPSPVPNLDVEQQITIPFGLSVSGGEYRVTVEGQSGKPQQLSVRIPAGIESGKKIRLRGQGQSGPDGRQGDLLITVQVAPHPVYRRSANNLLVRVPVSVGEALRGTTVDLPSPHGTISLRVPAGSSSGKVLRAKGMGVRPEKGPHGDLLAELEIHVPQGMSPESVAGISDALAVLELDQLRNDLKW